MKNYVHGYNRREFQRLSDQAAILEELLHSDTAYAAGSKVLEAGCGVGAQTVALAKRSLDSEITSIDISRDSLSKASTLVEETGLANIRFQQSDVMHLPFEEESFDHVFVCFLLEHLDDPTSALIELKRVLKTGGTITVIEGDHRSCFWHPETQDSLRVWRCMIDAQASLGHNALIGRQVYPLLRQAGFDVKHVVPLWVYADANNPDLLDGVVNKIIVPMVETAKEKSLELGLIDEQKWQKGIADLASSGMLSNGTFFYTWFKGIAVK